MCTFKFEIKLFFHPSLLTLQVVSAAPDIPLLVGGDSLHALRGPVRGSGDRHRYPTHRGSGHHPTASSSASPGSTACRSRHLDAEIREDPDHVPGRLRCAPASSLTSSAFPSSSLHRPVSSLGSIEVLIQQ